MTPERWQQIARTYGTAAEIEPSERDRFLSDACAGDDSLRREVESLLSHEAAEVVVDSPVWATAAPLFDEDADLRPGSTLGPYRIEAPLGAGGMGRVFRGTDTRLNRLVAIKVLPGGVGGDPEARARFGREARAIAALTHPHICTLYDVGRHDQVDYLVMEYLEGDTLAARLRRGPVPLLIALTLAQEIASALAHAHRLGVIHRDLKPANIMLTAGGAKLLDFGIAKRRVPTVPDGEPRDTTGPGSVVQARDAAIVAAGDAGATGTTRDGALLGTVRYMAPEQLDGRETDWRGDLFAFGVVLYEMVTGRRAFDGADAASIRAAILEREPAPMSDAQPQVPVAVDAIVRRCLAKDPDQRWHTTVDVVRALQEVSDSISQRGRESARIGRGHGRTWIAGVLIATLAGSGIWIAGNRWRAPPAAMPSFAQIRAVAVLPLRSLSTDQEYFADAMTEQLIADLAKIRPLRVISRTSMSHYKNARKPVPTIARELQVDAIIEGFVVHAGDRVQVSARLIRGTTGEIIWTQSFERNLRDVLMLQREIAGAITSKVGVTLTPAAQVRLASARPVDPEMHRQVLLGRHQAARATEESFRKAIQYFDGVIAKDPGNALAHAGLAEAYMELSGYYMPPRQVMPRAKRAAETALGLDDSLADAHAVLGYIHLVYDWDGPAAEKALLRALDLNPTLAMARLNYSAYLASQNRHDDAASEIRRAVNLDPLSIRTYSFGTLFLLFARRYDEAIELARKGLEFEPGSAFTMAFQGVGYSSLGRHEEAVVSLKKAAQLDNSLTIRALQAHVLATADRDEEARTVLRQVEVEARARYFCPYEVATVYVSLGDPDTATEWFRKGIEDKADCMPWLGVEPWMDPFRSDPRYVHMLKEIGLTPIDVTPR